MPSPMMLTWPFRSLTRRTGPRLTPIRTLSAWAASRIEIEPNSASSGSPRKVTAAPSPVSRMMRSRGATSSSARPSAALKACLICSCSATGFFEYSTISRKSTLQTSVRPELSIGYPSLRRTSPRYWLFYAHAGFRPGVGGNEENPGLPLGGRGQHHPLGDAELHLARGEIGHHHRQAAFELLGGIGGLDPGENGARALAEIEGQLEELVGSLDHLGLGDARDPEIELVEVVDCDGVFHGFLFLGDLEQRVELLRLDARDEVLVAGDPFGQDLGVRPGEFASQREEIACDALGEMRQHRREQHGEQLEDVQRPRADVLQI